MTERQLKHGFTYIINVKEIFCTLVLSGIFFNGYSIQIVPYSLIRGTESVGNIYRRKDIDFHFIV